jgi:hypothetical protein
MRETPKHSGIPIPENDPGAVIFGMEKRINKQFGTEQNSIEQMKQLLEVHPHLLLSDIIETHGSVESYKDYLTKRAAERLKEDSAPDTLAA